MANTIQRGCAGFYKEHYCRSLHEFHACLYLEHVKHFEFIMEPFAMISEVDGRKKIPDLLYIDYEKMKVVIVEIKQSDQDLIDTVVKYAWNKYRCPPRFIEYVKATGFSIDFDFWRNSKNTLKKFIIQAVGKDEYLRLVKEYRSQAKVQAGFPGSLNPMFGKRHSLETKKKILATKLLSNPTGCSMPGKLNPMYGKTHTAEAKIRVGAKWYDISTKNHILQTSLFNRLEKLSDLEFDEFCRNSIKTLSGIKCPKLPFMNGIMAINQKKVIEVFGSYSNFWNAVRLEKE